MSAFAGPYRTVRIAGLNPGPEFVLLVPRGRAIEIVNFVSQNSANLYVGPSLNENATGTVRVMTGDTDAKQSVAKGFVIAGRNDTDSDALTYIIVNVAEGDTALLTYKIIAN